MTKQEDTVIDLDPEVAERRKRMRRRSLNVVRIPALRFLGFSIVLLFVLLYTYFVFGRLDLSVVAGLGAVFFVYCVASWLVLYHYFDRVRGVDLGLVFLGLDMVLWTVAVYYC